MKVEVKRTEGCHVTLGIELPSERADAVYHELLADFRSSLKMPGFRRGKVPDDIIRKRFAGELRQEVVSKLVPVALNEAIKDKKLRPVERPTIEEVVYEEGQPLSITTSFQVQPDIELKKYTGITVELDDAQYKITDEEVEEQLEHLRQRSATFKPFEGRRAAEGDFVLLDLRGEPRSEGSAPFRREGVLVAAGGEGFSAKLVGAEPGQRLEFSVEHPDDFSDPALAGKTVDYIIDVHELKERILPELDDEFAKDLGQFESLDELRGEIRRQLEEEAAQRRRTDALARLFDMIAEANPAFELPAVMVQRRLAAREEDMRRRIAGGGLNPDHIGYDWKAFREAERPEAEKAVRNSLLRGAIARTQGISVKPKDVHSEIAAIAAARGEDPKELRRAMLEDGSYEMLQGHLLDRAVDDWLLERNEVKGS